MQYIVVMTSKTGYVFRNFFETMDEAREFIGNAAKVLGAGETIQLFEGE